MSQHDYIISNAPGATIRADLNNVLSAIATMNSGGTEPSVMYPYLLWMDTTTNQIKLRNAPNSAWIILGQILNTELVITHEKGYLYGLTLSNHVTPDYLNIASGEAANEYATASRSVLQLPSAFVKRLDATWAAGSGNGGRSSSVSLTNTTYHVHLIRVGGTDDIGFDTSPTAANLIADHAATHYRCIGSILRESGAIVGFVQDGDRFQRTSLVADVVTSDPGTNAVTRTVSIPTGRRLLWWGNVLIGGNVSSGVSGLFSDLSVTDEAPAAAGLRNIFATAAYLYAAGELYVYTNTSAQLRSRISASDGFTLLQMGTRGWIDPRGRNR